MGRYLGSPATAVCLESIVQGFKERALPARRDVVRSCESAGRYLAFEKPTPKTRRPGNRDSPILPDNQLELLFLPPFQAPIWITIAPNYTPVLLAILSKCQAVRVERGTLAVEAAREQIRKRWIQNSFRSDWLYQGIVDVLGDDCGVLSGNSFWKVGLVSSM
jgi:hypothetical protein